MKNSINNLSQFIRIGYKLAIIIALMFANNISAQQNFTIQQSNGIDLHFPINGLKLTFDNNGSFSCWHNGSKQDISFISFNMIYFTELSLTGNTYMANDFRNSLLVYPNPTEENICIELGQIYNDIILKIKTITGQVITTYEFGTTNRLDIELKGNQAIYLLEIQTKEGRSAIVKILKY
jgi:hypothetical protein